jgi:hypothetical protein
LQTKTLVKLAKKVGNYKIKNILQLIIISLCEIIITPFSLKNGALKTHIIIKYKN